MVAPFCGGPHRLCRRWASCGFVGTFAQVHVHYTHAYLICDQVLQLERRTANGINFTCQKSDTLQLHLHQKVGPNYLADDVLDEFVHSEGCIGVDGKHFPQRVLVLSWLHVSVQKIAHHLQKDGVIVLNIDIHCRKKIGVFREKGPRV